MSYTDGFNVKKGLKQGSVLFLVLFSAVMELILREVKNANGNAKSMMFTDGTMLLKKDLKNH